MVGFRGGLITLGVAYIVLVIKSYSSGNTALNDVLVADVVWIPVLVVAVFLMYRKVKAQ